MRYSQLVDLHHTQDRMYRMTNKLHLDLAFLKGKSQHTFRIGKGGVEVEKELELELISIF